MMETKTYLSSPLDRELIGLGLSGRDLNRSLPLHLAQFTQAQLTPSLVQGETRRVAEYILTKRMSIPQELKPIAERVSLSDTLLIEIDAPIAQIVHECYHYLGSPRTDGIHFGLIQKSGLKLKLLALATLSPFDMTHVERALPADLRTEQVLVLSRLYAFEWAPKNAISYMLGRVFDRIRNYHPHIKLLLTYLNPNLGFSGSIYKATNWVMFGQELKRRYLYLDGLYVTDRQMINLYGTADIQKLSVKLGRRISISRSSMEPLAIYAYALDNRIKASFLCGMPHRFVPWSL
jgi:hypothetical protein